MLLVTFRPCASRMGDAQSLSVASIAIWNPQARRDMQGAMHHMHNPHNSRPSCLRPRAPHFRKDPFAFIVPIYMALPAS